MRMDPEDRPRGPLIKGLVGRGFRVDDTLCDGALAITPLWARPWSPPPLEALAADHVADLLAIDPAPEFLLLGTGATLRRPPPALIRAVEGQGFGVEAMDSRAAARAWGMIRGEGRWAAAGLYALDA